MLDPTVEGIELVKQMWRLENVVFLSLIVLFETVDPEWLILDPEVVQVMIDAVRWRFELGSRRDETARWIPKSSLVMVKINQLRSDLGKHKVMVDPMMRSLL